MAKTIVSITDQNILNAMGNWWQVEHPNEQHPEGNFTIDQITDALRYYADRWTWDTGAPEDKLPMDTLYVELRRLKDHTHRREELAQKIRSKVIRSRGSTERLAAKLREKIEGSQAHWQLA